MRSAVTLAFVLLAIVHQGVNSASLNQNVEDLARHPDRPDHTRPPNPDHTKPDGSRPTGRPDHTRPVDSLVEEPLSDLPATEEEEEFHDDRTIDEIISDATPPLAGYSGIEEDGAVRVEMDVLFSPEQWRDIMKSEDEAGQYKAITGDRYRWTNKIIPYRFGSGFSSSQRNLIEQSMRIWESKVCIKFRPYSSSDRNYIYIVTGSGCSSYIGMIGGGQRLTLGNGCVYQSVILHEIGHAVGFYHEQSRTDRDRYVTVYPQNAHSSARFNFNIASNSNGYGVGYDYPSIMHYGQYAFSSNGKRTIVTKDPNWQNKIGTSKNLSSADVKLARILYKC